MKPELKKMMLSASEDQLKLAVKQVIEIADAMAKDTESVIDDGVVSVIKMFEGQLMDLLDKIDGEVE